jgi:polar amino acid transport system substrate-binding protein
MKSLFAMLKIGAIAIAAGSLWHAPGDAQAQDAIKTGVDANFAPYVMPRLSGGLEGFNIDLGNELAKRLKRPIEIEGTQFSALIPGLNAKKYDFVLAPTMATPERAKTMLFSEGYMEADFRFLIKKDGPVINSLDDLKGRTISVNKGSIFEVWARTNGEKYGFKHDVYGTNADAVQAVLSGRADANLAIFAVVMWAAKQNPQLIPSYVIKTGNVWTVSFRHDDREGRARFNMALKCMKQDGTLARLYEKWFGEAPAADSWARKIAAGHGVPDLPGYDAQPAMLNCS